jgi:hypothetical protein
MSDLAAYPPQPVYKDRSAGLILIGILEIGLAFLCLLFLALMAMAFLSLATTLAGQGARMGSSRSMLGGGVVYLLAGTYFAVLGVGTLRGRRWARTIGLVTSWIWLIGGIFSVLILAFILPRMMAGISAAAGPSNSGIGACTTGCVGLLLFLLYLVMPGILVLFYRGPNVRATFEARDPSIPWTDRVPAPVLALTLMLVIGAASTLMGLFYRAYPLFGTYLTGLPAILAFLATGVVSAGLAWGVYQRKPAAWWACVILFVLGCVNGALLLFGKSGIRGMYEAMGMPAAQVEQVDRMGILDVYSHPAVQALMAVLWLGVLGFLIWTRKLFVGASERSGG